MQTIGFVGLGRMGRPMASNMCRKGFRLIVNDIDEAAMDELEKLQAKATKDLGELSAASEVIITMLPDQKVVRSVVAGPGGIFDTAKPGTVIMDMSTVDPATTDELAVEAEKRGLRMVDAPVGRLASHADVGESLFMVGGSDEDFELVKPMLEAMGSTIYHCGPVGSGMRTKLVNNFLAVASCQFNAEALSLATGLGLDLEKTLDVLYGTTAVNGQLKIAWPAKVLAGDREPGFTIDLAHKDLSLINAAAHEAKVPMPMGAAAFEAFSQARARGYGSLDFSSMLDAHCELAKLTPPRLKKK
jgi:4-hydroxybutyrate dehydrogenase / sulfolactaldehyde 3-reductase